MKMRLWLQERMAAAAAKFFLAETSVEPGFVLLVTTCCHRPPGRRPGLYAFDPVPAMRPIYKRLNMRPLVLLVIIGAAMSIMNLLPWGRPVAGTAAIAKMDITCSGKT